MNKTLRELLEDERKSWDDLVMTGSLLDEGTKNECSMLVDAALSELEIRAAAGDAVENMQAGDSISVSPSPDGDKLFLFVKAGEEGWYEGATAAEALGLPAPEVKP